MKWVKILVINIVVFSVLLLVVDNCLYFIWGDFTKGKLTTYPSNLRDSIFTYEYQTSFFTNQEGIRNEEVEKKKTNRKRVLVLGDSYVFGLGVEYDNTFCKLLDNAFDDIEFINAGLFATGPNVQTYLLSWLIDQYQIDGVLYCSFTNDVTDTQLSEVVNEPLNLSNFIYRAFPSTTLYFSKKKEKGVMAFQHFYNNHQRETNYLNYYLDQVENTQKVAQFKAIVTDSVLDKLAYDGITSFQLVSSLYYPDFLSNNLDLPNEEMKARYSQMKTHLSSIKNICTDADIAFRSCYFPFPSQYDTYWNNKAKKSAYWNHTGMNIKPEWLTETSELQRNLSDFWTQEEVPFYDLTDSLRGFPPNYFCYKIDFHWNEKGNQRVAALLEEWLVNWEL